MNSERKQRICTLLKGIESGDLASVEVINPTKYIQHNPQTHEGRDGLAALFGRGTSAQLDVVLHEGVHELSVAQLIDTVTPPAPLQSPGACHARSGQSCSARQNTAAALRCLP
ncbi:MAG: hypothetical protein DRI90_04450 [Deltaproteobacteria bacterium]|nr:MAG: hypothetical protein DRI90_04450 [Deltaproteobacteria bacterium]